MGTQIPTGFLPYFCESLFSCPCLLQDRSLGCESSSGLPAFGATVVFRHGPDVYSTVQLPRKSPNGRKPCIEPDTRKIANSPIITAPEWQARLPILNPLPLKKKKLPSDTCCSANTHPDWHPTWIFDTRTFLRIGAGLHTAYHPSDQAYPSLHPAGPVTLPKVAPVVSKLPSTIVRVTVVCFV